MNKILIASMFVASSLLSAIVQADDCLVNQMEIIFRDDSTKEDILKLLASVTRTDVQIKRTDCYEPSDANPHGFCALILHAKQQGPERSVIAKRFSDIPGMIVKECYWPEGSESLSF